MTESPWVPLSNALMGLGALLLGAGALIRLAGKWPWLGRLPGDIHIQKENFSFHFPIVTCLVISLMLTLLFNWFRKP
ncbi:MAG: DUF2905 domain-containing protein [Candidatus Omnitrophica bacterium]|nr:DUF2905 domain-containing protein [Candidatus Omnitrophota bacterium]